MTKLEEVARALFAEEQRLNGTSLEWGDYPDIQITAMNYARAAIEALREPSAAMTVKHWTTLEYSGDAHETCHAVWREMIDAILSEGK